MDSKGNLGLAEAATRQDGSGRRERRVVAGRRLEIVDGLIDNVLLVCIGSNRGKMSLLVLFEIRDAISE